MLRVGLLLDHPSPHMVGFLDALAIREDVAARVVYFRPGAPERRWGNPAGRLPHEFASGRTAGATILNALPVIRSMADVRADVWVVNSCYTALETWVAVGWLNARSIPWVYMNEPLRPRGRATAAKEALLRVMLRRAAGVVGMGREAERRLAAMARGESPSASVPYYVDLRAFLALEPPKAPEAGRPVRFFTAAQLTERKGIDVLLNACGRLAAPEWTLTIAGDGPLRSRYEGFAAARWPEAQVRFLGEVPYEERAAAFSGMHVFVFPSRWDGWGVAPTEAMAAGLPVISTDQVMSMREFLRDGESGYLVGAEDPLALSDRMRRFISRRETIPLMGGSARASLAGYTPEAGATRLMTFLEALPSRSAPGATRPGTAGPPYWSTLDASRGVARRVIQRSRDVAKRTVIDVAMAAPWRHSSPSGNRILVYHLVLPEDRRNFVDQLAFLGDHFTIVTVKELMERACCQGESGLAAISFDDGFRVLMADALEVLEQRTVKATFFVPTGFVEVAGDAALAAQFSLRAHHYGNPLEPMTISDVAQLARMGHEVGSHGVFHLASGGVAAGLGSAELRTSRDRIAEWTGTPPAGFAYPYGDDQSSVGDPARWVQEAGYGYAVSLRRGVVDRRANRFRLPREHVEGNWRVRDLRFFVSR